jgi:ribosomal-protein-alanine N-acetyltransferase
VKSRRLTLIPCTLEMAEAVVLDRAKAESLIGAALHPGWPGPDTRSFLPYYVHSLRQDPGLLGWGIWLMVGEGRSVIGDLGFKGKPNDGVVDIGYAVVPAETGKGYASEAARALVRWAFRLPGAQVKAVVAACEEDNPASARVLQNVGMKRNGRDGSLLKWRMTRREWERTLPGNSPAGKRRQELHYVERGSGFPVLLVHGFASSSAVWTYAMPPLAKAGYRAIAIDLPGFGRSYLPDEPTVTSRYTGDVLRFMDDLGIQEAALVGNSMGGFVCWYAAARAPERVRALVLVDSAGAPPPVVGKDGPQARGRMLYGDVRRETGHEAAHRARRGRLNPGYLTNSLFRHLVGLRIMNPLTKVLATPFIRLMYGDPSKMTREVFSLLHEQAKQARIIYAGRLRWEPPQTEPAELLSRIKCPTLVAWGDKDRIIPLGAMGFFMAHIPGATPVVFEDAGHAPMLEVPQEFNRALVKFLSSAVQSTGGDSDSPSR